MSYDMEQFKATYITECYELLEEMEQLLLDLQEGSTDKEALNAIFRCAHSIKGGAGAFGFSNITHFTHILEYLLDGMREGKSIPTRESIDTLLKSADIVKQMVQAAEANTVLPEDFGAGVASRLQAFVSQAEGSAAPVPAGGGAGATAKKPAASGGAVRYRVRFVPHDNMLATGNEPLLLLNELAALGENVTVTAHTDKIPALDDLAADRCYLAWDITLDSGKGEKALREVFEFVDSECDLAITAEVAATAPEEKEKSVADAGEKAASVKTIRVDIDKVDRMVNQVGELVITQAMIFAQTKDIPSDRFSLLLKGIDELAHHTRELQEAVMSLRMQPVKSIFSRMPRIVRDLSSQLGKDIRIETFGENTEIDKTVIEQLGDPLTHMIRNSIDHGIESPAVRAERGKPAQGVIRLSADSRGGRIIIEITDDGGGINRERVLSKAREKGLVAADAALTDEQIDNLVFMPGFSTAEKVTNISGRGVGMDVVRRNIEGLGGKVAITSTPGAGSVFTVTLPLTLAILDGMIVRVGREFYIIPIANIIETMRPRAEEVRTIADGNDLINVRGEFIPLHYLSQSFRIGNAIPEAYRALVVLVESGRDKMGLVVDELVGQQQVVIKSLEENADPVMGISGATILGDGKVALILDITQLHGMASSERREQRITEAA
ncbi:MAG: chemotaxis protein CheA [Alphaproteobacteria bacterium]|nr:chemotaxis protein CheA [Alphaproteobacteria bacterium]